MYASSESSGESVHCNWVSTKMHVLEKMYYGLSITPFNSLLEILVSANINFSAVMHGYGKCSKILNTLLFFFSDKLVFNRAGITKCLSE